MVWFLVFAVFLSATAADAFDLQDALRRALGAGTAQPTVTAPKDAPETEEQRPTAHVRRDRRPLAVETRGLLVRRAEDGSEELLPENALQAGQEVEFVVTCRNTIGHPVEGVDLVVPIPEPGRYVARSATAGAAGPPQVSVDGGASFSPEPLRFTKTLGDGTEVEAIRSPASYTHLRWQVARMEPAEDVTIRYRITIAEKIAGPAAPQPNPVGPRDASTLLQSPTVPFPLLQGSGWNAPVGWNDTLPTRVQTEQGGRLVIQFDGKQKSGWDKAVATRNLTFPIDRNWILAMDVDNRIEGTANLALAISAPQFMETEQVSLKPGMNRDVLFDLSQVRFKSAESKWRYQVSLPERTVVRFWCFLVYPKAGSGRVDISNVRMLAPPGSAGSPL